MHNFNVIPVRHSYVLVSANYSGGTSVADFTDPASAYKIGTSTRTAPTPGRRTGTTTSSTPTTPAAA
jgi:hypothetical protein